MNINSILLLIVGIFSLLEVGLGRFRFGLPLGSASRIRAPSIPTSRIRWTPQMIRTPRISRTHRISRSSQTSRTSRISRTGRPSGRTPTGRRGTDPNKDPGMLGWSLEALEALKGLVDIIIEGKEQYKEHYEGTDEYTEDPTVCYNNLTLTENGVRKGYFVCPDKKSSGDEIYCCGDFPEMHCCQGLSRSYRRSRAPTIASNGRSFVLLSAAILSVGGLLDRK